MNPKEISSPRSGTVSKRGSVIKTRAKPHMQRHLAAVEEEAKETTG